MSGAWLVTGELTTGYPYTFGPFGRVLAVAAVLRLLRRQDVLTLRLERVPGGEGVADKPLPVGGSWYPSRPPPGKT